MANKKCDLLKFKTVITKEPYVRGGCPLIGLSRMYPLESHQSWPQDGLPVDGDPCQYHQTVISTDPGHDPHLMCPSRDRTVSKNDKEQEKGHASTTRWQ